MSLKVPLSYGLPISHYTIQIYFSMQFLIY